MKGEPILVAPRRLGSTRSKTAKRSNITLTRRVRKSRIQWEWDVHIYTHRRQLWQHGVLECVIWRWTSFYTDGFSLRAAQRTEPRLDGFLGSQPRHGAQIFAALKHTKESEWGSFPVAVGAQPHGTAANPLANSLALLVSSILRKTDRRWEKENITIEGVKNDSLNLDRNLEKMWILIRLQLTWFKIRLNKTLGSGVEKADGGWRLRCRTRLPLGS